MLSSMRRTQVQLDEDTYQRLRRRAYQRGLSISAVAREILGRSLGTRSTRRRAALDDFPFIASGRSEDGETARVSEQHDEALVEAFSKRRSR
jgi:plasmid stability protein